MTTAQTKAARKKIINDNRYKKRENKNDVQEKKGVKIKLGGKK